MKGMILAGGSGTRLYPVTRVVSKHFLPVYDKPMIYYPLSVLMLAGIREFLPLKICLGSGSLWELAVGSLLCLRRTERPDGRAQAFIVGGNFVDNDNVCIILGDNIFYRQSLPDKLRKASSQKEGAAVFDCWVKDPERYGIVTFHKTGRAVDIEEKPSQPKSNCAITRLYFYDNRVLEIASSLKTFGPR